jgi:steroid delta-isomerase-like uncharacterized protein
MNLAWAKEWLEDFGGSMDGLMNMYADDVEFEDIIFAEKFSGKAKLQEFFGALADPKAGVHTFKVVSYSGGPEAGAVEWTWNAKHASDFMGVAAAGKETNTRGVSILTFKGGKIASQHDYWDAAVVFKQLGAIK